jgi:hypothetical protein
MTMRKPDSRSVTATAALAAGRRDAPAELVCLALMLALAALAYRIAMAW